MFLNCRVATNIRPLNGANARVIYFTVSVVFAKYSVRFPLCCITSRLPHGMI